MNPKWFEAEPTRSIAATDYAKCQGAETHENGCSPWLLRTAMIGEYSCYVSWYGYVHKPNTSDWTMELNETGGIRPVIQVDLKILQ